MVSSVITTGVETDRKYPYLGINKEERKIVLFYALECGTLISDKDNKVEDIGYYSEEWEEEEFELYSGNIILSNT